MSESFYIIWCEEGSNPKKKHLSHKEAIEELKRLASLTPNKKFHLLQALATAVGEVEVKVTPLNGDLLPNEQWIAWKGGECPLHVKDKNVKIRIRGNTAYPAESFSRVYSSQNLRWSHIGEPGDIMAYCVVEG